MNGSNEPVITFADVLLDQIGILMAVISRRVVQQQLFAFAIIFLISWLLYKGVYRLWQSNHARPQMKVIAKAPRALLAMYHLLTPVLALVFLYLTMALFARRGIPYGLLVEMSALIWLWLIYRLLLAVLHARLGDAVRPYRNWILIPIFLYLAILQIVNILPGSIVLVDAAIVVGAISVTVRNLLFALVILYLFNVAAWLVGQIMVQALPKWLNAEQGVIESVAILVRYTLLGLGILFSLGMLGIDFGSLAIIAGGLSVGIGIGLQEYVANFVSGLVILFEQTMRPGDVVEVEGMIGRVEDISLRATTVQTNANEELIIPNSNFTSQQVKNLTKTERHVRVSIPFAVSCETDPELVRQLATEAGAQHPLVLANPAPQLFFLGFGESSLDFALFVSISRPILMQRVKSDLYYTLWGVFAQHNIEIPNPQRDLNLGDGWEKFTTQETRI